MRLHTGFRCDVCIQFNLAVSHSHVVTHYGCDPSGSWSIRCQWEACIVNYFKFTVEQGCGMLAHSTELKTNIMFGSVIENQLQLAKPIVT